MRTYLHNWIWGINRDCIWKDPWGGFQFIKKEVKVDMGKFWKKIQTMDVSDMETYNHFVGKKCLKLDYLVTIKQGLEALWPETTEMLWVEIKDLRRKFKKGPEGRYYVDITLSSSAKHDATSNRNTLLRFGFYVKNADRLFAVVAYMLELSKENKKLIHVGDDLDGKIRADIYDLMSPQQDHVDKLKIKLASEREATLKTYYCDNSEKWVVGLSFQDEAFSELYSTNNYFKARSFFENAYVAYDEEAKEGASSRRLRVEKLAKIIEDVEKVKEISWK